jgi:hypothetical protein
MEEEAKHGSHNVTDFYIEEKHVKDVTVDDIKTPIGDVIYNITFENGEPMQLTRQKFEAIRTTEPIDASKARERLVREIGMKMYAVMVEYGLKMSEIDPTLNEVARLVNDNQGVALDILWGKDMYTRSLIDVNRVLLTKYGSIPAENPEGDDGVASDGGTPDSADTK